MLIDYDMTLSMSNAFKPLRKPYTSVRKVNDNVNVLDWIPHQSVALASSDGKQLVKIRYFIDKSNIGYS